ncbi:hypothetical protein Ccrd_025131 [Cynara cardunculus var. scolymus]|uniref:Uncharacterized protein n=1 Tax=Cynara cardunculus var. scolymus TaxID=59895 RepID=A0A103XBC0_CYNCS|nr:hypothetical protein Ccrd_025131 [Cynara cardunculus var. scolymus]
MTNQEGNSGSVVGIRGEFELTYPMPNVDVEVGEGPRNKTKWWHRSTHQNKTKWWHHSTHRNKTKWWQYRNLQRNKTVAWLRNIKQVPLQQHYEAVAWDIVYSKLGPPLVGGVPNSSDTIHILLDCKENGQNLSNQLPPSIYMIPSSLQDLSPSSFEPQHKKRDQSGKSESSTSPDPLQAASNSLSRCSQNRSGFEPSSSFPAMEPNDKI